MELGSIAIIGVIVLAIAFAWGMYQNSQRNRRRDVQSDVATRQLYDREPEVEPRSRES